MRIALVSPQSAYASYGIPGEQVDPPLGLLSLATVLRGGHDIKIFDGQLERGTPQTLAGKVIAWRPDVVGISLNFSTVVAAGLAIAKAVAEGCGARLVAGGNYATFNTQELASSGLFSFIAKYEAEASFPVLLDQLEGGVRGGGSSVPGIAYVERGQVVAYERAPFIEQLDSLPFSDFDLFDDPARYVKSMVTSRGCPYRCVYCSTVKMWEKWRYRSAENVVEEMLDLHRKYSADTILFADDIFLVRRDRAEAICQGLERRGQDLRWGFSTRLETLKDDLIPVLARAGVHAIFLGIESGSDRILKLMSRHYSADEVHRKIALCADHGITCTASFIIGLPWEDEADVRKTFDLMERVETPRVLLNIFTPLPGTDSVDRAGALGIRILNNIDPARQVIGHGHVHHETRYLTAAQIEELWLEGQGIVMDKGRHGLRRKVGRKRYGLLG